MPVVRKTVKSKTSAARPSVKPTPRTTGTKKSTTKAPARSTKTVAKPVTTRAAVKPTNPRTAKKAAAASRAKVTPTKPTRGKVTEVAKPKSARKSGAPTTGPNRVVDETTGFALGTDSHTIAMELLKGGESRADIIERLARMLPPTSNRGTPKPVANMVASVLGKMRDAGFTVSQSFILEAPTRASKAKATKARNARLAARQ